MSKKKQLVLVPKMTFGLNDVALDLITEEDMDPSPLIYNANGVIDAAGVVISGVPAQNDCSRKTMYQCISEDSKDICSWMGSQLKCQPVQDDTEENMSNFATVRALYHPLLVGMAEPVVPLADQNAIITSVVAADQPKRSRTRNNISAAIQDTIGSINKEKKRKKNKRGSRRRGSRPSRSRSRSRSRRRSKGKVRGNAKGKKRGGTGR